MFPRRPEHGLVFPLTRDQLAEWVHDNQRPLLQTVLEGAGIGRIEGFYIEHSAAVGPTIWLASELGLSRCFIDRRRDAKDGWPARAELQMYAWTDVVDPEYTVTAFHNTWEGHLLVQYPRIDLRDSGGTGGQDFLGSLARAILKRAG